MSELIFQVPPIAFQDRGTQVAYILVEDGVTFAFEKRVSASRSGLETILYLYHARVGCWRLFFPFQDGKARGELREELVRLGIRGGDRAYCEKVVALISAHFQQFLLESDSPSLLQPVRFDRPDYLLTSFLIRGQPTILAGEGGGGKSYFTLALLASLAFYDGSPSCRFLPGFTVGQGVSAPVRSLYLDWETDRATVARRFARLSGDAVPSAIHYWEVRVPLFEVANRILDYIVEEGIELLVIDSYGLASGLDPETANTAIRFFDTIRAFRTSVLILTHLSKEELAGGRKRPYGSIYVRESARIVWCLHSDRLSEDELILLLVNEKANNDRLARERLYKFRFVEGGLEIREGSWTELGGLASFLPLGVRLQRILELEGECRLSFLAEWVEEPPSRVERELKRLERLGRVVGFGAGVSSLWRWREPSWSGP